MSDAAENADYSRAFEVFVSSEPDQDDVVGLLAYALYKKAVREAVIGGRRQVPAPHRTPSPTEREAYRGAAERLLQRVAQASVDAARPEILQAGFDAQIARAESEIKELVRSRTRVGAAIGTNLVAWIITLAVTVLVVNAFYLPNWQERLVPHASSATSPPSAATR